MPTVTVHDRGEVSERAAAMVVAGLPQLLWMVPMLNRVGYWDVTVKVRSERR